MELKFFLDVTFSHTSSILLIVPYGIEIYTERQHLYDGCPLLIVPYGIEIELRASD